jgi:tol-pal system protein YbgF
MKKYGILIIPAVLLFMAGAMPAGNDKDLIVRLHGDVVVLQRHMRDLQESFDKSQGMMAPMLQKISDNSDNTLRTLTVIEESLKTSQTTQTNSLSGTNSRISNLSDQVKQNEQKSAQILAQLSSLKSLIEQQKRDLEASQKADQEDTPRFDNPEQLYAFAYGQFAKGQYDQAIRHFQMYIDAYGTTETADNALYWQGEAYFQQSKFEDSLRTFERVLTEYPRSDKVAAALLKKGLSLLRLERREEGVAHLRMVIAQYQRTQEAALATEELTRLGENSQPSPATGTKPSPKGRIGRTP